MPGGGSRIVVVMVQLVGGPQALTSVTQPSDLNLSMGGIRNLPTNVTPSWVSFNVSYDLIAGNPHESCMVTPEAESGSGTGSVTSPIHKRSTNGPIAPRIAAGYTT